MRKLLVITLLGLISLTGTSFKTLKRCAEAGTRYCDDNWTLIGTGPGGVLIYQKNCTLIVAAGPTCVPTADPEFKEVAP